jgi:Xaa-Pro aminopeptidase
MVKDRTEIAAFREAASRLSAVARRVLSDIVRIGRSERDVAADIDYAMRQGGFERPAFDTIVASGPNSALPHARPGPRILAAGDGVVLDFGGVYDGYCVDLTRTVQLAPGDSAFEALFEAVRAAQAAAIAAVRPGVKASAVDGAARDVLAGRGLGDAFVHGTGHGLGLEIHEAPRIGKAGGSEPDEALVAGMVFTVEPGAYVPGLGGVRIEDDVLVTEDGCEVLTDVPIERLGRERR